MLLPWIVGRIKDLDGDNSAQGLTSRCDVISVLGPTNVPLSRLSDDVSDPIIQIVLLEKLSTYPAFLWPLFLV